MKHFQQPLTIAARGLLGRCRDNVRPGGLGVAPETGAAEDAKAGMWVLPGSGKPKAINPLQTTFTTLWHAAQQLSGPFHLPAAAVLGSRGAVSTPPPPPPPPRMERPSHVLMRPPTQHGEGACAADELIIAPHGAHQPCAHARMNELMHPPDMEKMPALLMSTCSGSPRRRHASAKRRTEAREERSSSITCSDR